MEGSENMLNEIDAYGILKNSIDNKLDGKSSKTILITSAESNEGKTTVATKLAKNIAMSEKTVVLVDANLRNPSVNILMNIENGEGLIDVIDKNFNIDDVIKIKDNCSILTSGSKVENFSAKLEQNEMKELINNLRSKFDYVIIDAPSALSNADAKILSAYVDGVLLVVRTGFSKIADIKMVKKEFEINKINLLGTVLNDYKGI